MSQAPSMPMYWDAYLADTTHLTTEEHGAYLLLLAAMWRRNGSVPDDDKDNARILGLTPAKWRKVKARLVATISGFHANGTSITQEKLRKTWEITQEKIDTNRANGAKGGRPKYNENKDMAKPNGYVSDNPNETIPEPEPEPYLDDDDSAGEDLSFREKVLVAAGHDSTGVRATGRIVGGSADFAAFSKACSDLSISQDEALAVVEEVAKRKADGPVSSLKYFHSALQQLAGAKNAPSLKAVSNGPAPPRKVNFDLESFLAENPELN